MAQMQHQGSRSPKPSDLLTVAQAADELGVSASTVWRWVDAEKLPAVRVGPKAIRIKREDVRAAVQPVGREGERTMPRVYVETNDVVRPYTAAENDQWDAALAAADRLSARILARRKGKPLSDSAEIIRQARDDRSQSL